MELYPSVFLIAAALAWICNELGLIPWRRGAEAHWTERARLLFPARVSRQANVWTIPACLMLLSRIAYPESLWGLVLAGGFLGALLGNFPMDRTTNPGLKFGEWTHIVLASWLLQLSGWANYIAAAALMPDNFGWSAWAITGGFLIVFFALQFGLALRLMRGLRLLKPAPARLQSLVDATSAAMRVPVRATWEMLGVEANAVAFVTTRELAFTAKLLAVCPDDEIKVICAHELGHLTETRWALTGRIVGAMILFPLIFVRPAYGLWQEPGIAVLGFLAVLIWLGNVRLSQTMEKRADKVARESVEETALYARALERLYRTNQAPAVRSKRSGQIHPDLYDRMVAAGLTPDYPKPAAPSGQNWPSIIMTIIGTIAVLYLLKI